MKQIFLLLIAFSLAAEESAEKIFTDFYQAGHWDESGFYFSGSQFEITKDYVSFLEDFMAKNQIQSVVDIGCGDWAFSRYIDWSGIQYIGIDIVEFVVERNQKLFARPSVTFIHANALEIELPKADLLVCKDVFQHLSNAEILKLLEKFKGYNHCLITNFVDPVTLSSSNTDIFCGEIHYIDLSKPPFNVKGQKVLNFVAHLPKQTYYMTKNRSGNHQ